MLDFNYLDANKKKDGNNEPSRSNLINLPFSPVSRLSCGSRSGEQARETLSKAAEPRDQNPGFRVPFASDNLYRICVVESHRNNSSVSPFRPVLPVGSLLFWIRRVFLCLSSWEGKEVTLWDYADAVPEMECA